MSAIDSWTGSAAARIVLSAYFDDHFFEVFAPDDGKGPDGKVHLEGETGLFCLCGAGGSAQKLDAHFAEVFTPADSAGPDSVIHKVAG